MAGFTIEKVRLKVSWEGMPLGNSRKVRKKSALSVAQSAISTKSSQPARVPQKPSTRMSSRRCLRLRHWRR